MTSRHFHRRGRRPAEDRQVGDFVPRVGSTMRLTVLARVSAAMVAVGLVAGSAACGYDPAKKSEPPPAQDTAIQATGVNFNVGSGSDVTMIRNLMIVSEQQGRGFLSGSIQASNDDRLKKVSGTVITDGGKEGEAIKVTVTKPVTLDGGSLVVLTDRPAIKLRSPDLRAGLTAKLRLSFASADSKKVEVPIEDGNKPDLKTVQPESAG